MKTCFAVLALAAVALPASVGARGTTYRFTRDGATYVYSVTPASGGRRIVEGRRLPIGSGFRLIVRGDRVDGMSGGEPVSFRMPASNGATLAAR